MAIEELQPRQPLLQLPKILIFPQSDPARKIVLRSSPYYQYIIVLKGDQGRKYQKE